LVNLILKRLFSFIFILLIGFSFVQKINAASLSGVSDKITTSRPSASASLQVDQAANDTSVSVVDNGSIYLASDSAILQTDTGQSQSVAIVASMSGQVAGTPNTRTVYFNGGVTNTHHKGTAVLVNITATHVIQFTTAGAIPNGGKIVITFPGAAANTASPSATAFSFNNLQNSAVKCYPVSACNGISIAAPSITLTTNALQSGGTTIYVLIGCTAQSTGTCTTFAPALINPTKSAVAGTADTWKLTINTTDSGGGIIDSSKTIIGTVESVQVQASIEPTLTFTIAGLANATGYGAGGTGVTQCGTEASNSGIDSTATTVNLGILISTQINKAGQTLTVTTNASQGYAITATSSGHFINAATGIWLADANVGNPANNNSLSANDTPVPAAITAGTPAFGISPCGPDVPTSSPNWGGTGQTVAAGALFSNPWNTGTNGFYATIASYTGGAVSGNLTHGTTVIRYAATPAGNTPAGTYSTVLTYVATPTF
jgi:hypothetical protein